MRAAVFGRSAHKVFAAAGADCAILHKCASHAVEVLPNASFTFSVSSTHARMLQDLYLTALKPDVPVCDKDEFSHSNISRGHRNRRPYPYIHPQDALVRRLSASCREVS